MVKKSETQIEPKKALKNRSADGLWMKCSSCGEILHKKELEKYYFVCNKCGHHFRIGHRQYIEYILDNGKLTETEVELSPADPLLFPGYKEKLKKAQMETGLKDGVICGTGKIGGISVAIAIMDFAFMGGSMGSVVGEKITRTIELARKKKLPLIIVSASGGARMQEGIISLMQLAKTTAALARLSQDRIPYISVLTDPTTAGVMASYASLGDVIIAEPGAQLGFAGPRVIEETIGAELPPGFQSSEFMLEHGMIDMIVPRKQLKEMLIQLLSFFSS